MTTKLKRTIEETTNAVGEVVEKVVAIEMDVQAVSDGITNILIGQ